MIEKCIEKNESEELDFCFSQGLKLLNVSNDHSAILQAEAVYKYITDYKSHSVESTLDELDIACFLGAVLGNAICSTCDWEWIKLSDEERLMFGISNHERSVVIYPISEISHIIQDNGASNGSLAAFNAVVAGILPPVGSKTYTTYSFSNCG